MSYCGQATQSNADYLASKTGLDPAVALAWLRNECQSVANPTNPLNIRYYGSSGQIGHLGGFAQYTSTHAGLDAAANLINNSANYSGIRAAIKAKSPYAEAHAIEMSPWAAGHYGGTSSKYGNIVSTVKRVLGGTLPALPTGSTTMPPATLVSYTGPTLQSALGGADFTITDPAQLKTIVTTLKAKYPQISNSDIGGYLVDFIGHKASTVPFNYPGVSGYDPTLNSDKSAASSTDPLTATAQAISGLGDVVGKLAGFGAGLVLIALGVFLYSKSIRSKVEQVGTVAAVA